MNKPSATANVQKRDKDWERVLVDGQGALKEAKLRVRQLKAALKSIEDRIKNDEPFPTYTGHWPTQGTSTHT